MDPSLTAQKPSTEGPAAALPADVLTISNTSPSLRYSAHFFPVVNCHSLSGDLWEAKNTLKLFSDTTLSSPPLTNSYGPATQHTCSQYQLLGIDCPDRSNRQEGDSCNGYGMK